MAEYQSDEGYFEANPRDDVGFHEEILMNPKAERTLAKAAVKRAIERGVQESLARQLYRVTPAV